MNWRLLEGERKANKLIRDAFVIAPGAIVTRLCHCSENFASRPQRHARPRRRDTGPNN
jgi:hypothetical protein